MTDVLTDTIRLTEPTVGADTGLWGGLINNNMVYVDTAINKTVLVTIADMDISLVADGSSSDQARYLRYDFTGALTADRTVTLPANVKVGWASNDTSGGHNVILSAGGTTLTLSDASWIFFAVDGSNNVTSPTSRFGALNVTGAVSVGGVLTHNSHFTAVQSNTGTFSNTNFLTMTQSGSSAASALVVNVSNGSSRVGTWQFTGTEVGSITLNGTQCFYNTTSDYRLKVTFGLADVGELIDSVPVYNGAFVAQQNNRFPMMLAHEMPAWAVTGVKDARDEEGRPVFQQVDYSKLVPAMWAELQSLRRRVSDLELEID